MQTIGAASSAPREENKHLTPQGAVFVGPYPREAVLRMAGFKGGRPSGMRVMPLRQMS